MPRQFRLHLLTADDNSTREFLAKYTAILEEYDQCGIVFAWPIRNLEDVVEIIGSEFMILWSPYIKQSDKGK